MALEDIEVLQLGGPSWEVGLGRRDSTTASRKEANSNLPGPFLNLANLTNNFANQGLSVTDLVALSGDVIIYQMSSMLHPYFVTIRQNEF